MVFGIRKSNNRAGTYDWSKLRVQLLSCPWKCEDPRPPEDVLISWKRAVNDESLPKDFSWEVEFNRWPLSLLGLWPLHDKFTGIKFWLCFILMLIFSTPPTVRTVWVGSAGAIKTLIEAIPIMYVIVQTILFKYKNPQVKIILMKIYENWSFSLNNMSADHRKSMVFYGRKTRLISAASVGFICVVWIVYLLRPAAEMLITGNRMKGKFPLEGVYPFVTNISPNYEIVYTLQALVGFVCALALISVDGFLILAAFHACGQLAALCKTITNYEGQTRHVTLLSANSNDKLQIDCSCLKCIVDNHVSLSKFVETIDEVFNKIIMARLVMNTCNFCGLGYSIIKSTEENHFSEVLLNTFFFTATTSSLFMYCWISEQLLHEADNVGKSFYELDWYNANSRTALTLFLPIQRSRTPFQITAGKFFVMSLNCYQEWFIKALGYVSVILAVKSGGQ